MEMYPGTLILSMRGNGIVKEGVRVKTLVESPKGGVAEQDEHKHHLTLRSKSMRHLVSWT
jgi:hypothetical protein